MISITTKFHGPTNSSSARVSATVSDYRDLKERGFSKPGRIMVGWNHAHNPEENHRANGWRGPYVAATRPATVDPRRIPQRSGFSVERARIGRLVAGLQVAVAGAVFFGVLLGGAWLAWVMTP